MTAMVPRGKKQLESMAKDAGIEILASEVYDKGART